MNCLQSLLFNFSLLCYIVVILMGSTAAPVAAVLSALGLSGVHVMEGGFERRRGWVESGLATEAALGAPTETQTIVGQLLLPFE
jgi:3-mercaptopyruvate sulfurtransferase SseA